jgi:hypothetical protein
MNCSPNWSTPSPMPDGFCYEEDIISESDEAALIASLAVLELKPFEFHGHLGNRRVTSFGLHYDYARRTVAEFSGRHVEDFQQGGVNEYPPGVGIGWHKDKPQFGVFVGASLSWPWHSPSLRSRLPGSGGFSIMSISATSSLTSNLIENLGEATFHR